ncbi:MAG: EF-hand domain-containing protein, partial [Bradyrhizobium sp.]|nr:EF-hand domain-containing protein [Bradyrhizobium sp.]
RLRMSRTGSVRTILSLAGSLMLAAESAAWAQPVQTVQQFLSQRIPVGAPLERYLQSIRSDFFMIDADGDLEITQRDVDLHTVMEGVQARTHAIQMAMRYDLDGDGFVIEDEIRRAMKYEMRAPIGLAARNAGNKPQLSDAIARQIDNMVQNIMALDTDKDGKVSVAEAAKPRAQGRGAGGQAARARQLLALESASKGVVTLTEYQAVAEALFRQIDTDKDGVVSQQELTDHRMRAARVGCEMPAASEKAKVFVLGSYQTEALSSVTLGSQDVVVHAGRVVIEPGDDPLYVVIATYSPTIWQFSGAVERVERLMMTSSLTGPNSGDRSKASMVGATGIPKERISFFAKSNCLAYFHEAPSSGSLQTVAAVRAATGKTPEIVAAKYSVSSFKLPSGAVESSERGARGLVIQKTVGTLNIVGNASNVVIQAGPSRARDDLLRFSPGGVIEIDPKAVVGSHPPANYEVLPQQAGLVQLLASGAMTQNSAGEYVVRQKIRFPAGLAGGHSVTFLIMKGAPYPEGDPGHSCVIMEETGQKKGGCR